MATTEPTSRKRRVLRTRDEIFAAGYEDGANLAPLTDEQVNLMASLFAPVLNAPRETRRGAA